MRSILICHYLRLGVDCVSDATKKTKELQKVALAAGLKLTRQRVAILRVLGGAEDQPDAIELHQRARRLEASVSLSTVYRTLAALSREGAIRRHAVGGSPARFEPASSTNHNHIIDIATGEVTDFVSNEIDEKLREIAQKHGYELVGCRFDIYGRRKTAHT